MGVNTRRNTKNKGRSLDGLSSEELTFLNQNYIHLVSSKRKCGLICNACGIHLPSVGAAFHHTSSTFHNTNLTTAELRTTLLHLPPITDSHRIALNLELKSAVLSVVLDTSEMQRRKSFVNNLIAAIEARIPNIKVKGTGSLWFGLALQDTHCSLDVVCSSDFNENGLLAMQPTMDNDDDDNDNDDDFDEKGNNNDTDNNGQSSPQSVFEQLTNDTEQSMGYVLSDVFELLQLNACEPPPGQTFQIPGTAALSDSSTDHDDTRMSGKRDFPKFHTVLRTRIDYFYLCLTDFFGVNYRISIGYPYRNDLDLLINTYLNLNDQARQLAILFRKLSRIGSLDMPENGTFEETVIPLLVIFYLQHCEPPVLPNLHTLYRQHRDEISEDSYHQVLVNNNTDDCSFITDIELIHKFYPNLPVTDPSLSNNVPCLADLWLGFLRFYLFDFKMSSCMINILEPEPVTFSNSFGKRFTVIDPFNPKLNLCKNLTRTSQEYITSQLLAAYGYFGVPRLASNGRHLFTRISVAEKSSVEPIDNCEKLDQSTNSQTMMSNNKIKTAESIHLTPIIDDSDNFASNLKKVTNLVTEKFQLLTNSATIKHAVLPSTGEDSVESSSSSNCTPSNISSPGEKTLPFLQMFTYILTYVMDELFESTIVPDLVNECLNMSEKKFHIPLSCCSSELTLNDSIQITRNFAHAYWLYFFNTYISKGKFTMSKRIIKKATALVFRKSINSWSEGLKIQNSIDSGVSIDSPRDQSQFPQMNYSTGTVLEDLCSHLLSPNEMIKDDLESVIEQSPSDFLNFEETYHLEKVENSHNEFMTNSYDTFLDDTLENDVNDVEMHEHLECTFDLDYGDDLIDYEPLESSTLQRSTHNNVKSNINSLTSNDSFPVNHLSPSIHSSTNELVDTSNELIKHDDNDGKDATVLENKVTFEVEQQQQHDNINTSISPNNNNKITPKSKKKKGGKKKPQWEDVISSRSAVTPPIDDDRPDYYNSKLLDDLEPEDFDFKFSLHGQLSGTQQTSVLGLASRKHPSTLIAHLDAPQPQCQACKLTGHRQSQCETSNDKSVSFSAWQKLLKKLPWPPTNEQIHNLNYCLNSLEEYHETDNKVNARQELVKKIHQCFLSRFPTVQLELFGSCANGFDLQTSDLDVCVFFPPDSDEWYDLEKGYKTVELIKQFRKLLFNCANRLNIRQIKPVLRARVPILKVSFSNSFEADISFSNYLALSNTRMLAFYTKIQPKLRTLGIALKTIAKITKIRTAASGGISSYACIIMLIHYLQQIDQLPVLQELYEGSTKPTNIVNGWNVWYQNNLSTVNRLWKPANPEQSVGDMWLGFLRYYLFEFDHDTYVVTIRQKKLLIRFMKMWRSLFAIEDPFNLNHNLTAGLSHSIFLHLLTVFHTVLVHHTTFLLKQMPINQWCYYLFSPEYIVVERSFFKKNTHNELAQWAPLCSKNRNETNNPDVVALNSLIGHFLGTNQASQSNSQKPINQTYRNSNQNRQSNSFKNFTKCNSIPKNNTSANAYRNPFKPQNCQIQPILNNFQQQQPTTSNLLYTQPYRVNTPNNCNFMNLSIPYRAPLFPVNTIGPVLNYGFIPNNLTNNNTIQPNPYSRYLTPVISVNNQQNRNTTTQANCPMNYQPQSQQNGNNNKPKNCPKSNPGSSSSVSSTSSNHPSKPKKYENDYNMSNSHQTTNNISRKSHNHDSHSTNLGINNNHTSKSNNWSSPGKKTKNPNATTSSYGQKQFDYLSKVKSNSQQSPQKGKYAQTNEYVSNSHEIGQSKQDNYSLSESNKPNNSYFKNNRNPQRFNCTTHPRGSSHSSNNKNNNNNDHLIDKNLIERLHNMSTTFSSSQSSNIN
ncbi:unnamed protein product [Schistosoma turkestanicum]|nr:unnamed protein product [Schistosoma turkestanicum]